MPLVEIEIMHSLTGLDSFLDVNVVQIFCEISTITSKMIDIF